MTKLGILSRLADYNIAKYGGDDDSCEEEMASVIEEYKAGHLTFKWALADIVFGHEDAHLDNYVWGLPCAYPLLDVVNFLAEIAE